MPEYNCEHRAYCPAMARSSGDCFCNMTEAQRRVMGSCPTANDMTAYKNARIAADRTRESRLTAASS